MALSVLVAFARFLNERSYTTSMWERGYSPAEANEVCRCLTEWTQSELKLPGEFMMAWAMRDGTRFSGDSELVYMDGDSAWLMPNPFLQGDAEGFTIALQSIVAGNLDELYETELHGRILHNAW